MNKYNKYKELKTRMTALTIVILSLFAPSAPVSAQTQIRLSPDSLVWSAGDTAPQDVTLRCSKAWQADSAACQGLFRLNPGSGYGLCIVEVSPLSVNQSTSDRQVNVTFTHQSGATATLHLVQRGTSGPGPGPDPDPWLDAADDLARSRSWIQTTTVTSADGSASYRDVEWYDGLGYRDQVTRVGASTEGRSLVAPVVFDRLRRDDAVVRLPYADHLPDSVFRPDATSSQEAYYYALGETRPYFEKVYGTSPEGRPLSWQREGADWDADGGHKVAYRHRVNTAGDGVPRYRIAPGSAVASHAGVYPAGSLLCTETEDEEGSVSRTYTDGFGKTVLTERETGMTLPGGGKETARTLYVYDLRDSLTLVVQPEGMAALAALPGNASRDLSLTAGGGTNGTVTDRYCFVWRRDGRGNVVSGHVPGGGTVRMAYDKRGREVLRTDGRLDPSGGNGGSMVLTLHDQYDRVVGERYVASSSFPFSTLQTMLRDTVLHTLPAYVVNALFTGRRPLRTAEYHPFGTISYPSSGDGAFVPETGFAEPADLETVRIKGLLRSETVHPVPDVDGSVPAGAPSVTRYYHYDSRGRVIQTAERWSDGMYRRVSTKYSFTGDVLGTKETVLPSGSGATPHSLATVYIRDARGRVLGCERVLDGTDTLARVDYEYDALGRLAHKRVEDGDGIAASSLLETAYAYDVRGWTTEIGVGRRGAQGALDTLFAETLRYATPRKDAPAGRYDGNVSETGFKHRVGTSPSYSLQTNTWSYYYDGLKRLTSASHFAGSSGTVSLTDTERGIAYDLDGNMTALKRYGPAGLENDLAFLHTGNRMTSLTDANAVGNDAGAKSFTYDANGSLTHDGRKDLDIRWNILNLVSGAVTHDGSLTYARLSDGTLVWSQIASGSVTAGKRYCGSFVFATGTGIATPQVESIAWDEGRIFRDAQTGTYRDCWFAGDHLGDVRSVVEISRALSSPVVLEQNDYLPFGTKVSNPLHAQLNANRWRYAGKEEFPEVQLLDFGARLYDPFIARWTAVDIMAPKYPGLSPYVYCGGNSIGILDDGGLDLVIAGKNNSSVTFKTDLINKEFSVASLGIDWKGNYTLRGDDILSAGLDLVGIVDPTGVADAANAALQYSNGDYLGAALSAVGVVPYVGDLAKAGKVGKDVRIINSAITALKAGEGTGSITYRAFTRGNFRENLVRRSGGINPKGKDAHHLLPKAFEDRLLHTKGINVNDPKYGRWVNRKIHNKTAQKYNMDFKRYLDAHENATEEQLIEFAESLMDYYGL